MQSSTSLHGAHLLIGAPDAKSNLPVNSRFIPRAIVRNTTDLTLEVDATVRYKLDNIPASVELPPLTLRAFEVHLEHLDPVSDEPSLRLLSQLIERQRRHLAELGPGADGPLPVIDDLGALEIRLKATPRALRVMSPLDEPARDEFVEVTAEGDPFLARELYINDPEENHVPVEREEQRHFFHALMDAELCAAELMARNSHEHPEMPWDFHVDMARQTWDEMRHARLHSLLMPKELGCGWGDYPVGFSYFRSVYAHDLLGRLALFNSTSEQKAMWRHSHRRKVLVDNPQRLFGF